MIDTKHGGARAGAGRKPKDPSGAKLPVSYWLAPDVVKIIRSQPNQAEFIEAAIREKQSSE